MTGSSFCASSSLPEPLVGFRIWSSFSILLAKSPLDQCDERVER